MRLKAGRKAPDFELPDEKEKIHRLSSYLGKFVLVYFYPKDDTPGCTKEACAIKEDYSGFRRLGIKVLGISTDSVKSHKKFKEKYDLPFTLLSDSEKEVVTKYDSWGKKKFMGRDYEGTFRNSFLIGPDGKIKKIYEKVVPESHAKEVLADIKNLLSRAKKKKST